MASVLSMILVNITIIHEPAINRNYQKLVTVW